MSISFKNSSGENILSLNDFTKVDTNHPIINYTFSFNSNDFKTEQVLEAEPLDLEYLLEGLIYFRDNLNGAFFFEPIISGRINIKFEMGSQGHIGISGTIYDKSRSISLNFKFSSDQTFLSDLIYQCSMTIDSLKEI